MMKRISGLVCVVLLFGMLVEAQIPKKMNYQGYLTNSAGNPVSGNFTMVFSIYDVAVGGAPLWHETRSVAVANGMYNKVLGDGVPILLDRAIPYYLGVQVGDDAEMMPRQLITSAMYALFARKIEGITLKNSLVGIGTENPLRELHIQAAQGHSDVYLGLTNGSGGFAEIGFDGDSNGVEVRIQDTATKFYIGANGNVGVGTPAPKQRLHLQADTGISDTYLRFVNGFAKYADVGYDGDSAGLEFRMQGVAKFFVGDNGNVGIGHLAPTHKLTVNGTVRAKEVLVDNNNWPDFVFADNYALMPLSAVEQHIQATRHLPGVPSAQEVAEQGVSVGAMQATLLQKIEELTLHMIALEKDNARLRERVSTLEQAIDAGR